MRCVNGLTRCPWLRGASGICHLRSPQIAGPAGHQGLHSCFSLKTSCRWR